MAIGSYCTLVGKEQDIMNDMPLVRSNRSCVQTTSDRTEDYVSVDDLNSF